MPRVRNLGRGGGSVPCCSAVTMAQPCQTPRCPAGETRPLCRGGRFPSMTDTGAALRVAFVYTRPRVELRDAIARGEAPDTGLLGQNHLAELGVEANLLDSVLRRQHHGRGLL